MGKNQRWSDKDLLLVDSFTPVRSEPRVGCLNVGWCGEIENKEETGHIIEEINEDMLGLNKFD